MTDQNAASTDSGLYVICLTLPAPRRIRIGSLGVLLFPAGRYFYIGSAQRNLAKRVARHKRRRKLKRWQIDYLRAYCRYEGVEIHEGATDECGLAQETIRQTGGGILHHRFGASDCRCNGHLVFSDVSFQLVGDNSFAGSNKNDRPRKRTAVYKAVRNRD
jgi:sugar fermentation stimulation protein A